MDNPGARPLRNYHTHTWRCQHARGTEEQYVRNAIAAGYAVLGFADHTPWPYQSDFVSGMRMRLDQFADYRQTVLRLREAYAGQIEIPLGLECEAFPEYTPWLRDLKAECLDYILLGNHYDFTDEGDHYTMHPSGGFYFGRATRPEEIRRYAERTLDGMRTGLYTPTRDSTRSAGRSAATSARPPATCTCRWSTTCWASCADPRTARAAGWAIPAGNSGRSPRRRAATPSSASTPTTRTPFSAPTCSKGRGARWKRCTCAC